MLFAFEGHTVPIDDEILAFLRDEGVLEEAATMEDAQKFLEHHLKAEECYDFYMMARRAAHDDAARPQEESQVMTERLPNPRPCAWACPAAACRSRPSS